MAYKNQKKNKAHIKKLRLVDGTKRDKSKREKQRNSPPTQMTQEDCEELLRQIGLI